LFTGHSLEQPITQNDNPVYFSGTNFSRNSIVIEGDTVTFVFNSGSRPDPHSKNSPSRWDFGVPLQN